jgi:hypothetical protein
MNITRSIIGGTFVGATLGTGALFGVATVSADAAAKAPVTVTIKAEGTDLSGVVKSRNPELCAANRKVKVFKVINGENHLFTTDTTDEPGNAPYEWSTGNTGQEGTFFAKVSAKPGCRADVSPTITAVRTD